MSKKIYKLHNLSKIQKINKKKVRAIIKQYEDSLINKKEGTI